MELLRFSWVDYTLFAITFGLSGLVGIYFGYFKKQKTTTDYLLGGKKMNYIPVALSLAAGSVSGIALLSLPAEVYLFGGQFIIGVFSFPIVALINRFTFLPVLYNLQLTNSYDYFELRFNKSIKNIATFLYVLTAILYLPITIYAAGLAVTQVTGFDLYLISSLMTLFCIFYTTIGGLKAVVWTDTLQMTIILVAVACVFTMGTIAVGGLGSIWEKTKAGNRLEFFNMNPDPTIRNTFWTVTIGNIVNWVPITCSEPAAAQRFVSISTYRDAQKCLVLYVALIALTSFLAASAGFIIYAAYFDCDPLTMGLIRKIDQILPYYVLDVAASIPGLSGVFIAGLCCITLSTLSTYINTLAGILYNDFVSFFMPINTTDERSSTIMKILSVLIGLICLSFVFIVEKLGPILEIVASLRAITAAPVIGLFTMGMFFPIANGKGALVGSMISLISVALISIKNKIDVWNGVIRHETKPLFTHGCNVTSSTPTLLLNDFLSTELSTPDLQKEEPFWLFKISFHYYATFGLLVTLIIGLSVSWLTRNSNESKDPKLFASFVRRYVKTNKIQVSSTPMEELNLVKTVLEHS